MSSLLHDVLNKQTLETDNLTTKLSDIQVDTSLPSSTGREQNPLSPRSKRSSSPNSEDDELIAVVRTSTAEWLINWGEIVMLTDLRSLVALNLSTLHRNTLHTTSKAQPYHPAQHPDSHPAPDPERPLPLEPGPLADALPGGSSYPPQSHPVWFQHYRMENFHDESLPAGKWTRRESKQNWRVTFLELRKKDAQEGRDFFQRTGFSTPGYGGGGGGGGGGGSRSTGYQTPREIREEKWKQEADESRPGKLEMREMYKELGGRKSKTKSKYQTGASSRDRGGWSGGMELDE
ncbi:hypothetical protein FRB90_007911 [Tulasnella sp. 427]|nr:hypothetical protein FRB90_007911 [Tulasnella sp. 427]